jgi:hypothetical protein
MLDILQFLNPWYLFGALAALIPLLIYLAQRRRAKRVVFGSVWFLRALAQKIVRQRQTSEWLLLLLRMLILAILAVAFARPVLLGLAGGGKGAAGGSKAMAIVMDLSGSMQIGERLPAARKAALAALERLRPGDVVAVYGYGNSVRMLLGWTSDPAEARAAIEEAKNLETGSNLSDALRQVMADILDRVEQEKEIVAISDMQAVGWKDYNGDWTMSRAITLTLVEAGGKGALPPNVGIVQLQVPRRTVLGATDDMLGVRVQNFTPAERNIKLKLELQGKEVAAKNVSLTAESSQTVLFPYRFGALGEIAGRFVLEGKDDYPPDDQAFFVVTVEPKIKIVVVNGSPSEDPNQDSAFFLVRALAPSTNSSYDVKTVLPAKWAADDLEDVSVVVVSDVELLSDKAVENLGKFVNRGGGIMFFAGNKTIPEKFNRMFAELAPCRLDKRVKSLDEDGVSDGLTLTEMNTGHPCLQLFAQPRHGDFTTVHFMQYYTVLDSQAATVLARFSNKRPAVLTRKVGKGATILVVSAINRQMNDFSLRANFVPFIQETTKFLAAGAGGRDTDALIGNEKLVELPAGVNSATLLNAAGEKSTLDGKPKATVEAGAPPVFVAHFVPLAPGIYTVQAGKETYLFAANTDPRESDLKAMGSDEVTAALTNRRGTEDKGAKSISVTAQKAQREDVENRQRIGWYLLIAAGVLLLIELIVADRITIKD